MNLSIWRYSHLLLAVSSFLFLILATITGIILAFEPAVEKYKRPNLESLDQITLAQSLSVWKKKYPSISEIEVDNFKTVIAKSSDFPKEISSAYIHPKTGEFLGESQAQNPFFEWVTALHRSLFLHELGRFFVGITAFLLLLITISGTLLLIQRQSGIRNFFKKIPKENFAQYYHVVLSRWILIPIFILALTGSYLSLVRFEIFASPKVNLEVDLDKINASPQIAFQDFKVFKEITLDEVRSIEFPFSEDPEDYFTLKLRDRELAINQITGEILSEQKYPFYQMMTTLSLELHTGRTNLFWALILAIASINILFFIYSGFAITYKRVAKKTKNKFKATDSQFIILVGSENGGTWDFANGFHQQLLKQGKKSFIDSLNQYQTYPEAEHLIVFSSTYGIGEAPSNANNFKKLLKEHPQNQDINISVVGFGSHSYPDFCKYAFELHDWLSNESWAKPLLDIHTVNDKSIEEYSGWTEAWSAQSGILILGKTPIKQPNKFQKISVISNTSGHHYDTFLIRFQAKKWVSIKSGDLLAIYPANDHRERLYSIGMVDKNSIQLSVRLHPQGLGSSYLHELKTGENIKVRIINNSHFHFPKKAKEVVMICNGTGIGPFLGMISQCRKNVKCHLYAGFRDSNSMMLYKPQLEGFSKQAKLATSAFAFSREIEKQYVGDLVEKDADKFAEILKNGGVIMLCGSLAMQRDVMEILKHICEHELRQPLSHYQAHAQILSDCY
ncbi:PepSY domain-containing protein [Arcicella sp. LKC2W]|uniref:PepSY domain-containing protein n=1 Tax=Arcicella sp. LKC2W TaxID=2984198 RepID=UPI002B1EAFDF|nr:PepSY domain-containing protein [Arcicella sp. LKC2W]MEA5461701.1 PepSY domain-containing protein [Arcicella sp. LKC2W]